MKPIIRPIVCRLSLLAAVLLAPSAWAQSLEIIALRHRGADEVLPQLQPFIESGGALSGLQDKLFVRTSARNLKQLRELVAALDTPRRRLLISLRSESAAEEVGDGAGVGASVRIGSGKVGVGGTAALYSSDRQRRGDLSSQVQTFDGGRAMLSVGQSYLLPLRQVQYGPGGVIVAQTLVRRDIGSGFVAEPHLNGEQVTVDISPRIETLVQPADAAGPVESQRLYTSVSGRLGEWIVLGGADDATLAQEGETGRYGSRRISRQARLLLKVEALD